MTFPLNEEQESAAKHLLGPLLINAGAGTGKTRTLTERFANAVVSGAVEGWDACSADRIVAITFTDKAAGELAERIRKELRRHDLDDEAQRVDAAWLSTIHGFCSRLLRRHALDVGLDPYFAVADTVDGGLMRERAFELAARRALGKQLGRELFASWEYDDLYKATAKIAARLSSLGHQARDISVEPGPEIADVHERAVALMRRTADALCSCKETKTTARHQERCAEFARELEQLGRAGLSSRDLAFETWRLLCDYGSKGSCAADARETLDDFVREKRALVMQAADALAAPLAQALGELVTDYLDEYASAKTARSLVDFDDLQAQAYRLALERPEIAEKYRNRFRLLMVDEFQDTDELQLRLIGMFARDNLCTVGDEYQSIFRFRGAEVGVYRQHVTTMLEQGARLVGLVENYRSHPEILAFVNGVFGHSELFGSRFSALQPGRREPDPPLVPRGRHRVELVLVNKNGSAGGPSRAAEAHAIAQRFARLRDESGVPASDMVILVRAYRHAPDFAEALSRAGFVPMVVGGDRFFGLPETEMCRALLGALANPLDDEAMARLLVSPMSGVSDDGLALLMRTQGGARAATSLWNAMGAPGPALSESDARAVERVCRAIGRGRADIGSKPLSAVILTALEDTDTDLVLLADRPGCEAYANILKLARMADAFEADGGAGPTAFAAFLDARERLGEHETPAVLTDESRETVRIMSIHAAKGLEFPVVAVPQLGSPPSGDSTFARLHLVEGAPVLAMRLPSTWRPEDSDSRLTTAYDRVKEAETVADREEAQRLFYVACTRAQEVLILCGSANLSKPADQDDPLAWLRRACGDTLAGASGSEPAPITPPWGGQVMVQVVEPGDQGELDREAAPAAAAKTCASTRETVPALPDASAGAAAPPRLSYSAIGRYRECPRRYWAERVVGIGDVTEDAPGDPRAFGSAVHAVLQVSGPGVELPARERIDAIARFHGLDEAGADRLASAAADYAASDIAARVRRAENARLEWPFAVEVSAGHGSFVLAGAMDAYVKDGPQALVVDYKTGRSGSGDELRERYRLQAQCYAYVAMRDGASSVDVVFVRPEVSDGQEIERVSYSFVAADADGIEDVLVSAWSGIAEERFEPLASWNEDVCRGCPVAGGICPVTPPRR